MKHCNDIQQALRDRFDVGEDIAVFAEDHVATCDACRNYRADLAQLADELGVFELASAPDDLSARIIQHVRERRVNHSLRIGDYVSIAVVGVVASLIAGWYMPVWIEPTVWWSQVSAWLVQADRTYSLAMLTDRLSVVRDVLDTTLAGLPVASQPMVWTALAVSCVSAIAFNGYMAVRMRIAGD